MEEEVRAVATVVRARVGRRVVEMVAAMRVHGGDGGEGEGTAAAAAAAKGAAAMPGVKVVAEMAVVWRRGWRKCGGGEGGGGEGGG